MPELEMLLRGTLDTIWMMPLIGLALMGLFLLVVNLGNLVDRH